MPLKKNEEIEWQRKEVEKIRKTREFRQWEIYMKSAVKMIVGELEKIHSKEE